MTTLILLMSLRLMFLLMFDTHQLHHQMHQVGLRLSLLHQNLHQQQLNGQLPK
jgi:hypothetical protein